MKNSTLTSIDNRLKNVLSNCLLPHKETLSTNPSNSTTTVEVCAILMNEKQVFDATHYNYNKNADGDDNTQLPLFKLHSATKKGNCEWWWLRDTSSLGSFALVFNGAPYRGNSSNYGVATYQGCVRPLIIIG